MDIPRPSQAKARRNRRLLLGAIGLVVAVGVTVLLSRLKPAAPTVERNLVWVDTVKRGPMIRQVRAMVRVYIPFWFEALFVLIFLHGT